MPREVNPQRVELQDKILRGRARGATWPAIAKGLNLSEAKVRAEYSLAVKRMSAVAHDRGVAAKLEAELDEVLQQAWQDHDGAEKAQDKAALLRVIADVVAQKAKLFGFETPGETKNLTIVGGNLAELIPRLAAAER